MDICVSWHDTARHTTGQTARVSMTVVSAQSGHGTAWRSRPSTLTTSVRSAAWYASHFARLHAMKYSLDTRWGSAPGAKDASAAHAIAAIVSWPIATWSGWP